MEGRRSRKRYGHKDLDNRTMSYEYRREETLKECYKVERRRKRREDAQRKDEWRL